MNKRQKLKDDWIRETQMFQRIAGTGEETYEQLSAFYDQAFGKKTVREREVLAENAKINTTILRQGQIAGEERKN